MNGDRDCSQARANRGLLRAGLRITPRGVPLAVCRLWKKGAPVCRCTNRHSSRARLRRLAIAAFSPSVSVKALSFLLWSRYLWGKLSVTWPGTCRIDETNMDHTHGRFHVQRVQLHLLPSRLLQNTLCKLNHTFRLRFADEDNGDLSAGP